MSTLQRLFENSFRLLPPARRYPAERRVRGWLELRRLKRADCVVVSFGKSGRTWVRVMLSRLYQLQYGLPSGTLLEFGNYHRLNTAIPRVLFTHDNYLRECTGDGRSKRAFRDEQVVLLVRHPADVAMSQYFQWMHRMRPHKIALNAYPPPGIELSPFEFMMGPSGLAKVVYFLNEWADGLDEVRHSLVIRYEDLRADTVHELERLAGFLGLEVAPEVLRQVVEYASVENMKQREAAEQSGSDRLRAADRDNPDSYKTRRAKVGGYVDYFDDDQIAEIEGFIRARLDDRFGYRPGDTA